MSSFILDVYTALTPQAYVVRTWMWIKVSKWCFIQAWKSCSSKNKHENGIKYYNEDDFVFESCRAGLGNSNYDISTNKKDKKRLKL